MRVAKPAQGLPPSVGMQRAEARGESVVKPTLQRSVSSRTIGTRATQGFTPSLASNRAASWPQLTQFNFQRTAREGRLVDWSTFPPELKLRTQFDNDRSPSHSENDQRVQGWLEIPSTHALRIDTIGHAIKLLGSLANASFLPSIG